MMCGVWDLIILMGGEESMMMYARQRESVRSRSWSCESAGGGRVFKKSRLPSDKSIFFSCWNTHYFSSRECFVPIRCSGNKMSMQSNVKERSN